MQIQINGSKFGSPLSQILMCEGLAPGDAPSYETCKLIYEFHPLGAKMVDAPISKAQSQPRKYTITPGPEDQLIEAFEKEWKNLNADIVIADLLSVSRRYGAGGLGLLTEGEDPKSEVDWPKLWNANIAFNVWDPLNMSGSIVLNQMPNAMDFLKPGELTVNGTTYHRSRTIVKFNERPVYLGWTASAFGYVGRSVYQRALYPLKSFLQSMLTDDLVIRKSGVLVAAINQAGAIVDNVMQFMFGRKREVVREAETGNVISIAPDERIETLNMQNLDGAYGMARGNVLKNIATAADMPAVMLENETMVEGFGEGTEDAKQIAQYVDRYRLEMEPVYAFLERVCMYRAWNPQFFKALQNEFPELGDLSYETMFVEWRNGFTASWPNLLIEPESEKSKSQDVQLKAMIALVQVLLPEMDPVNKAILFQWLTENVNALPLLFPSSLNLDMEALQDHAEEQADQAKKMAEQGPGGEAGGESAPAAAPPFSARDSEQVALGMVRELQRRMKRLPRAA